MDRRFFLGVAMSAATPAASFPVLDAHIHLFDPTRPQGVPWPPKDNPVLYKTALPDRYRRIAAPFGVVGAIEVECSPWIEDNQWVLDVIGKDKIMVGMIGNLDPAHVDFRKHLDRFRKDSLFLGIRYGNLWGRDLGKDMAAPGFIEGIKALADAGLALDSANPTPTLIGDLLRLKDRVPGLRLVIDHLPQMTPSAGATTDLRTLAERPQVYVKVSEVLRRVDGRVPTDLEFYRSRLDQIFELFGEDRVIYGSDWPNSDQWAEYPHGFKIVNEYFTAKGNVAAEKYFFKNSQAAYRWVKR